MIQWSVILCVLHKINIGRHKLELKCCYVRIYIVLGYAGFVVVVKSRACGLVEDAQQNLKTIYTARRMTINMQIYSESLFW